jgi:carbamate kinase
MGPKVRAAIEFCGSGGRRAIIADLANAPDALRGKSGTVIEP